jgi:Protein of unknown function (DUF3102)
MTDIKTLATPAPADIAARINSEFAAINNHDATSNKNVVERAIRLGKTLRDTKEKVGHGKWIKWLRDNCSDISERTATRYMKLDSPEFRAALAKNDPSGKSVTVSDLTLRKALALANPPDPNTTKAPTPSDKYDSAENNLITKLQDLAKSGAPHETLEVAARNTIERLNEAVVRLKPSVAA